MTQEIESTGDIFEGEDFQMPSPHTVVYVYSSHCFLKTSPLHTLKLFFRGGKEENNAAINAGSVASIELTAEELHEFIKTHPKYVP